MPFTKADLLARSGLADRTIRSYMALGLIPRPTGHGLGAVYDDAAMVRAVAVGRMRASGASIQAILEQTGGWSTRRFTRYVAETDPAPAPAPEAAGPAAGAGEARDASSDAAGAPSTGTPDPGRIGAARARADGGDLDGGRRGAPRPDALDGDPGRAAAADEPLDELALPPGPVCRVLSLLPGLVLMVDGDAPPIVQRVAAEICARYGSRRT